jgi:hypothetical protein
MSYRSRGSSECKVGSSRASRCVSQTAVPDGYCLGCMTRTVCGRSVVARVGAIRIALSISVVLSHVSIAVPQACRYTCLCLLPCCLLIMGEYVCLCEEWDVKMILKHQAAGWMVVRARKRRSSVSDKQQEQMVRLYGKRQG